MEWNNYSKSKLRVGPFHLLFVGYHITKNWERKISTLFRKIIKHINNLNNKSQQEKFDIVKLS